MEPTEPGIETTVEEIVNQSEEEQPGEQVYGYLYRTAGSEDATIYVDSRGFNLNGQSLIVTQNDEGNEIIVLVGDDTDGPPLDQTFAHTVLQSDEVTFEDGLKESPLVVDEQSEGLEFIKHSEEGPEEQEEQHMYIGSNGEILNISNENVGSPVAIESPLWSVSSTGHLKSDGTEMLFIPNPTVVQLAAEEPKHRKLMQLACIAHELQSADQKSSSSAGCDYNNRDPQTSASACESSVKSKKNAVDTEASDRSMSPHDSKKLINSVGEETGDRLLTPHERDKLIKSKLSKILSSVTSASSTRVVDNTVSVIHSTSSEMVQNNSLGNQTKTNSPPEFSPEKNSQNELPSDMLYPNVSNETFHDNLDEPSNAKPLEECSREDLDGNSQSSLPEVNDERCSVQNGSLELNSNDSDMNNKDSPLIFTDKTHNLNDNFTAEDYVQQNNDADVKMDDDIHDDSPLLVIREESSKSHDSDSNLSLMECHLSKEIDMSERTSNEDNVPNEIISDIDDDNVSSTHSIAVSEENESSLLSSHYNVFYYKQKAVASSTEKAPVPPPVSPDDKHAADSEPIDLKETDMNVPKTDENMEENTTDFEQSPSENLDSELVIVEDSESTPNAVDEVESADDKFAFREDSKSQSPIPPRKINSTQQAPPNHSVNLSTLSATQPLHPNEVNGEVSRDAVNMNGSPEEFMGSLSIKRLLKKSRVRSPREEENDDYSSSEESPLLKSTKKTYLKRIKKNTFENKINNQEKLIVLYSDVNECGNDTEMAKKDESCKKSPSPQINTADIDDNALETKVCAPRTYVNSLSKGKYRNFFRKKRQSLRSHNLRARTLSSTLSLNNGNSEGSDSDSRQNSFDPNNSDNLAWGKVLLETSFQPTSVPNDAPSTSFASQIPKQTSTPLLSSEQAQRKAKKYKRAFDKLLASDPPQPATDPKPQKKRKFSSRLHPNVIKATKSKYSSSHFSRLSKSTSLPVRRMGLMKRGQWRKMQMKGIKPKQADIQYLIPPDTQQQQPAQSTSATSWNRDDFMYSCSHCNFFSNYSDNFLEHLKYCSNRQPVLGYEVNNMDKRQRIRGEEDQLPSEVNNTLKLFRSEITKMRKVDCRDECIPSTSRVGDYERDADQVKRKKRGFNLTKKYGYGCDDVVWVKFKDRFWPALVLGIDEQNANVKLINYPAEIKGLKVKHENVRTFDNSKWNLLCISEAEFFDHKDIFVKAVQSCERFMSKKFLGVQVTGREFFSMREEVDFATDSASSESIVNESDSENDMCIIHTEPARKYRYDDLDAPKILEYILKGCADDYVMDIYFQRAHSKKHDTYFENNSECNDNSLSHKPWFGPFENKHAISHVDVPSFLKSLGLDLDIVETRSSSFRPMSQQEMLYEHFRNLFVKNVGKKSFIVSYVLQVMIPEAIVKAISEVKNIPLRDAELLFESEDSLDMENGDPSVDEIMKNYS